MTGPRWHHQDPYEIRFEWGPVGVTTLASPGSTVVVVDVLRFTTAVEAALSVGVDVYPYQWRDESARRFANSVGAVLADGADPIGPSLSPVRLRSLEPGTAVVLPSPNGSTCAALAAEAGARVVAACLRNASATAASLEGAGTVSVIACGERWPDDSLRPCVEDLLGAGAVIARLGGTRSPEAELAAAAWQSAARTGIAGVLTASGSGVELIDKGHRADVDYAAEADVSEVVAVLRDGRFSAATR
jgi:2-phosphosulfolactate phosphatase